MNSKTYVVAWDEVKQNVLDICDQLSTESLDFLVFDLCTEPISIEHSVVASKVRYYGHFYNALLDFCYTDADVFIFNAGDPRYQDFAGFTKKVETIFNESDVWIVAPNFTNDYFNRDGCKIVESRATKDLYLSTQSNGIWVAIKRDLALNLLDFMNWAVESNKLDFTKMTSGWGIDYVYCCWAIYEGKKIYRDWSVTMEHPTHSSYVGGEKDMEMFIDFFYQYSVKHGISLNKIESILATIKSKAASRKLLDLKISDVYINKELKWD